MLGDLGTNLPRERRRRRRPRRMAGTKIPRYQSLGELLHRNGESLKARNISAPVEEERGGESAPPTPSLPSGLAESKQRGGGGFSQEEGVTGSHWAGDVRPTPRVEDSGTKRRTHTPLPFLSTSHPWTPLSAKSQLLHTHPHRGPTAVIEAQRKVTAVVNSCALSFERRDGLLRGWGGGGDRPRLAKWLGRE